MRIVLDKIKKIKIDWFIVAAAVILIITLRGVYGNPTAKDLSMPLWRDNGPLELSPERGRYALTYSLVEDKSLFFSIPLAQFVVPDLGYINEKYVSLFAPGVSLLVIPGYLIGKFFGAAQVGTYGVVAIMAVLNLLLIRKISVILGASKIAGTIASLAFLFGTPAFAYAVNLYQHHFSTFFLLLALYLLLKYPGKWITLSSVFAICAVAVTIDYPNFFMFTPVGLLAISQMFKITYKENVTIVKFNLVLGLTMLIVVIPMGAFLMYNKAAYGDPMKLSGNIPSVIGVDDAGNPSIPKYVTVDEKTENELLNPQAQEKSSVGYFKTRNILNGIQVHLLGRERGLIHYTPVMLVAIIGILIIYKKKSTFSNVLIAIIIINQLVYSMWGDPWGGWAFGSRYSIPAYAILSIFISFALTKYRRNILFLLIFYAVITYSTFVNTLGAITTSAIPPKGNAQALEQFTKVYERYSYDRNWEYLSNGHSKSFLYNSYFERYLGTKVFYYVVSGLICVIYLGGITTLFIKENKNESNI